MTFPNPLSLSPCGFYVPCVLWCLLTVTVRAPFASVYNQPQGVFAVLACGSGTEETFTSPTG